MYVREDNWQSLQCHGYPAGNSTLKSRQNMVDQRRKGSAVLHRKRIGNEIQIKVDISTLKLGCNIDQNIDVSM